MVFFRLNDFVYYHINKLQTKHIEIQLYFSHSNYIDIKHYEV